METLRRRQWPQAQRYQSDAVATASSHLYYWVECSARYGLAGHDFHIGVTLRDVQSRPSDKREHDGKRR